MRRSPHLWTLAALAASASLFAIPARAGDPQALLRKSQEAMLRVPALRMTMDSVDHTKNKKMHLVVEVVQPDGLDSKTTVDGKVTSEIVSSGQKTFIRHDDGAFRPMPGNVAEMIMNARKSAALESVAEMAKDAQFVGHDTVNGTPASVYTFQTDVMGLTGMSKVWISDRDNLPLREERHTQGETRLGASPGVQVDRDAVVTFEYDPAIKIILPGS